jgi:CHAT domain-containing protein
MNKVSLHILLFFIGISFSALAQPLNQYLDSILANINNNKLEQAKVFISKAENSIKENGIKRDTIYADYLYAKGVYYFFQPNDSIKYFLNALEIWNEIKLKNNFKILKIYNFIARSFWSKNDEPNAINYFLKCYDLINKNKFYKTQNVTNTLPYYKSQTFLPLTFIYYRSKNFKKTKKYADEYILLNEANAVKDFNFNVADAYKYKNDIIGQERILKAFLSYYIDNKIENPKLLFKINYELLFLYSMNKNIRESIKYGEQALNIHKLNNLEINEEVSVIYSNLIADYTLIGDKEKSDNYKKIKNLLFPEVEVKNEYDILSELSQGEDYKTFKSKFIEFEKEFITKKDFNKLLKIYGLSLNLYEKNIVFIKDEITKQIETIEKNKQLLTADNLLLFDLFLAEFYAVSNEYEIALEICNKNKNTDNLHIKLFFYRFKTICEFYLNISNFKKSAYKTIDIATNIYGENDPRLLLDLSQIMLLNIDGNDKNTIAIATKTLKILKENKLENTEIAQNAWLALASVALINRNYLDAEVYAKKSLSIIEKQSIISNYHYYFNCILILANINIYSCKFGEALYFINKAKEIMDRYPQLASVSKSDYYYSLGSYYLWRGQYVESKNAYEECFEIIGQNIAGFRKANLILANYYINNNDNNTIKEIIDYRETNSGTKHLSKLLYLLNYNLGDTVGSKKILVNELKNIVTENNTYLHLLSDFEREAIFQSFADQFENLNTFLLYPDEVFLKEFINLRFYYKSLLLSNSIKSKNEFVKDKELYQEFKENSFEINKAIENKNDTLTEILELKTRNREIEKSLAKNNTVVEVPTLRDLNIKLKSNEAYVEIIRINKQVVPAKNKGAKILDQFTDSIYYGAIIIKKSIAPKFVLIDGSSFIESKYYPYFKSQIQNKNNIDKKSYTYLFQNIDEELIGIEKIYLVTDGIYNSINIESIYNPYNKKYIIDYLKVELIQSVRTITESTHVVKAKDNLKASLFGNPEFELRIKILSDSDLFVKRDFDSTLFNKIKPTKKLSYLVASQKEIQSIGAILKDAKWNVDTYTKDIASEENLKKMNTTDVLHIATHGFFYKNKNTSKQIINPANILNLNNIDNSFLKSGLFLAGAQNTLNGENSGNNNGILTAEEAKNLNLDNTELVVLSACETGLGDNLVGEGIVGIQRAFMIAGAKSVIMSLWKVDDASTQKLMTLFYSNWVKKKMTKADAFNAAKIEIKRAYPQPYYWAGFVMIQ